MHSTAQHSPHHTSSQPDRPCCLLHMRASSLTPPSTFPWPPRSAWCTGGEATTTCVWGWARATPCRWVGRHTALPGPACASRPMHLQTPAASTSSVYQLQTPAAQPPYALTHVTLSPSTRRPSPLPTITPPTPARRQDLKPGRDRGTVARPARVAGALADGSWQILGIAAGAWGLGGSWRGGGKTVGGEGAAGWRQVGRQGRWRSGVQWRCRVVWEEGGGCD